jgi:xanthine dehydrogenase iron-sulfur cluster and FAD-binding subunit A
MWQHYLQPASLAEALALLRDQGPETRIVAGGTDVLVELQRGGKPAQTLIDVTKLHSLRYVREEGDEIVIGGIATHNDVLASQECRAYGLPLLQACLEVGAPQIRNRGTIAGNLLTASPANDVITPLAALDATIVLESTQGSRSLPIARFYEGFRKTAARPDEVLTQIRFRKLRANQRALFLKLGLRRAQAISVIDLAIVLTFQGALICDAAIALGCLAPTIVRAQGVQTFLRGRVLDGATRKEAARLACLDVTPIDDVRASKTYRSTALAVFIEEALERIAEDRCSEGLPDAVVLLDTGGDAGIAARPLGATIETRVNGRDVAVAGAQHKTLLNMLRDDLRLTGAKEGCAEGECGACTVWLDGQAVMSCLVPAAQAHGSEVTTIEGLADGDALHPLQEAYIEHAAVQCGFCIPGMIMAGAKLLQEHARPTLDQHQVAISGNICRCTGYRKILDAMIASSEPAAAEAVKA